jgi:hypothetical protein
MLPLPFDYNGWDLQDTFVFTFYDAKFTQDFGSFSEGDYYSSVEVNLQESTLKAYDTNGQTVLNEQSICLAPAR